MELLPCSALGAEVRGLDLAADLTADQVAELHEAWLQHLVLFFRDQPLTPAQFLAFARHMGEPIEYPFVRGLPGFPEIIEVKKLPHETVNFGGVWHSDTTYLPEPPKASMLLARQVPPQGGDTLFANMYLAYQALPEAVRSRLNGLIAINSSTKADVSRTREDRIRSDGRDRAPAEHVAEHPAVRTHPETGRRALYVNRAHTVGFRGVDPVTAEELLELLFDHVERPEFSVRFRWQVGSIALWDNRCTQHFPVNDYQGHTRMMHRITLAGDQPR